MSFGNFEDVGPDEYDKIDSGAVTNLAIRDKKLNIFKNKVRNTGAFFSYVNESKIDAIAELAVKNGFKTSAFLAAMDKIILDHEKFPPFKVISEVTKSFSKQGFKTEKQTDQERYQSEETKEYLKIKETFIKLLGENKIEPFTHWWIKNIFLEINGDILTQFNLSWELFERCALFDWHDAGYTKNFKRIIENGNKKIVILEKRNLNNSKEYKRVKL